MYLSNKKETLRKRKQKERNKIKMSFSGQGSSNDNVRKLSFLSFNTKKVSSLAIKKLHVYNLIHIIHTIC